MTIQDNRGLKPGSLIKLIGCTGFWQSDSLKPNPAITVYRHFEAGEKFVCIETTKDLKGFLLYCPKDNKKYFGNVVIKEDFMYFFELISY